MGIRSKTTNLFWCSLLICIGSYTPVSVLADELPPTKSSIARQWNEALLHAIRNDYARPTVHARNLFHSATANFDAWALFDDAAKPYFLNLNDNTGGTCSVSTDEYKALRAAAKSTNQARRISISYAQFRLLSHRFQAAPEIEIIQQNLFELFSVTLGYDAGNRSLDITGSTPFAALGNRIAACVISETVNDGANEANNYANRDYQPVNKPLNPARAGTPPLIDANRWQPLQLQTFIDQSGNKTDTPIFLGAEWGRVRPFALEKSDLTLYRRDGIDFPVYHDPGPPALFDQSENGSTEYQWGHSLVAIWSSHLDPADGVLWDVSPGNIGNAGALPDTETGLQHFYQRLTGSTSEFGHPLNPATGLAYRRHLVPRGDYTRVLAEFWADGPDSETPPGHWFALYNESVSDHPEFKKRWQGRGPILDALSFDVFAYLALGGAMHDSAISAWSIKGWYDYIRPISALRHLAALGQSSDANAGNYNLLGIPLEPGYIETVSSGDQLAGHNGRHVGKIKVRAWRGPNYIRDPSSDYAGVGWILLENWVPYQRPTFVTPPFAGYVSGHSTFSRAAADILTLITGDEFFPGGLAEFVAKKNSFLVFENGPSVDVRLQWATYRDASDQTSLSRIWGGIHPPVDDVPGRKIGVAVAQAAFAKAQSYINLTENLPDTTLDTTTAQGSGEDDPITKLTSSGSGSLWLWAMGFWLAARLSPVRRQARKPVCAGADLQA